MKVSATYGEPDDAGDVFIKANVTIDNKHDSAVEYALIAVVLLNEDGVAIGGTRYDDSDCYIEANESGSLEISFWTNSTLADDFSKVKAIVSITTHKLEFAKIGSLECPAIGEKVFLKDKVTIGDIAEVNGITLFRKEDQDEGDADINIRTAVRNISDQHIHKMNVKFKLLDKKDNEITEDYDEDAIGAQSAYFVDRSFWGVPSGKAKNATCNVSASVAISLESFSAETTPVFSED